MRRVYLLRHAMPEFEQGVRRCLGRNSNPPLSESGKCQASMLHDGFTKDMIKGVYSSSLMRCMQTAQILSGDRWTVNVLPGMEEIDCGAWEGKSFDEIRAEYPQLYTKRNTDMSIPPPNGERFEKAAERALHAIRSLLNGTEGDLAVISHAGINRAIICALKGIPMKEIRMLHQPYSCINILIEREGILEVQTVGRMANDIPDSQEIYRLLEMTGATDHVRAHCCAVKGTARTLFENLQRAGVELDWPLIAAAAELHDMCRTERDHEQRAAQMLRTNGYLRLASVVAQHNKPANTREFDEGKLLYLADKLIWEDRRVTLSERFAISRLKCNSEIGLRRHEEREALAYTVFQEYSEIVKRAGGFAVPISIPD